MKQSETVVQQQTILEAAYSGIDIWRNNSGACTDKTGRLIRYGLGNTSAQLNARIKSSDLIGMTPMLVTPAMYGQIVGVFTALECKPSDWHMTPSDERAIAQARFHDIVRKGGGFAGFVTNAKMIHEIVKRG